MAYYTLTAILYASLIILGKQAAPELSFIALGVSVMAVLFSFYLTAVQAFVLKNWCSWCLTSMLLSVFILVFGIAGVKIDLVALLIQYRTLVLITHAIGGAIGLGAATITDFFFFKFLKDYRISHAENWVMRNLSQVIWIALAILVLSGIGLFIPNSEAYITSPKFIVKILLVFFLIINGVLLNIIISPRLVHISFGEQKVKQPGELHLLRKLAFASGAFSIVTWYSTFILGSIREWPYTFWQIFGVWLGIVLFAILVSQTFDSLLTKGKIKL
jgi:hypothetical protein